MLELLEPLQICMIDEYVELSARRSKLYDYICKLSPESKDWQPLRTQYAAMVNYENALYVRLHLQQITDQLPEGTDVKPVQLQPAKIEFSRIEKLVASCHFEFGTTAGTTETSCTAVLPNGFVLAHGYSGCLNPNDFNKDLGEKYAKERCVANLTDRLWENEGYARAMGYIA